MKKICIAIMAAHITSTCAQAQLSNKIRTLAALAHGRVGVACSLPGTPLDCNVNATAGLPMQSVYKLPIAMAVLHTVETGKLSLVTKVSFLKSDLISPDQGSPLRDAHPQAGVSVPVDELLRLAVSESDGVASDLLLRTLGGPEVVDRYVQSLDVGGMHIHDPEKTLGRDLQAQYRNDAQAKSLVALLRLLADRSPLNPEHTALLLRWMTESQTGPHRLKGLLPAGTVVAHKTGTSGSESRTNNATNDVGLITIGDGRKLAIAVLVADSSEPQVVREAVIAAIGSAVWQAAATATNPKPGRR